MKQAFDTFGVKILSKISAKFINHENKNSNNKTVNNFYFNSPVTFQLKKNSRKIKSKN